MRAFGRLLCELQQFEWQRRVFIQREVHVQSTLSLALVASVYWLCRRERISDAFDIDINSTVKDEWLGAVIDLAPTVIAVFAGLAQILCVAYVIHKRQYVFLPSASALQETHGKATSGTSDESDFLRILRKAQVEMASHNKRVNDVREGWLTRCHYAFFFAAYCVIIAAFQALIGWRILTYTHVVTTIVVVVIVVRRWSPVAAKAPAIEEDSLRSDEAQVDGPAA